MTYHFRLMNVHLCLCEKYEIFNAPDNPMLTCAA